MAATLVLSILMASGQSPTQSDTTLKGTGLIARYEGKVLERNTAENWSFMKYVRDSFPNKDRFLLFGLGSVNVARVGKEYLVVQACDPASNPGSNVLYLYWFSLAAKPIAEYEVNTGARTNYASCVLREANALFPAELIDTVLQGWGASSERQVFAVRNHQVHLVWKERGDGKPVPNNYCAPNIGCDTDAMAYTKKELLRILAGNDPISQLQALIWLDGDHLQPSPEVIGVLLEPMAERIRHRQFAAAAEIVEAVRALKTSPNRWVAKEAAEFSPERVVSDQVATQFRPLLSKLKIEDLVVPKTQRNGVALRTVQPGDEVMIRYEIQYPDGRPIQPKITVKEQLADFCLDRDDVIEGLRKGMVGMRTGGKRRILVPCNLALGEAGTRTVEFDSNIFDPTEYGLEPVPPKSDLVYVVELLNICTPGALPRKATFAQWDTNSGAGIPVRKGDSVKTQTKVYDLYGAEMGGLGVEGINFVVAGSGAERSKAIVGMKPGGIRRIIATDSPATSFVEPYVFEVKVESVEKATPGR